LAQAFGSSCRDASTAWNGVQRPGYAFRGPIESPPLPAMSRRRRQSPSPSSRSRRRHQQEEELRPAELRECALPGTLTSAGALRPQVLASPHAFAAAAGGAVACICGGSVVECESDGSQLLRCGPRSRPLQCCALSPCGRYLAAGEAGGAGRGPQVLIFDRVRGGAPSALRGHHHGVRLIAWSPKAAYLVTIGDMENEASDHQLILWSWPQGERLAQALCSRGLADLAFSPEGSVFAVVSVAAAKRWSIVQPQDAFMSVKSKGPPKLVGQTLPTEVLGLARGNLPGHHQDRRRRSVEDGFVAVAWGSDSVLHLLTRRGLLCVVVGDQVERWVDIGQRAYSLAWASRLCDHVGSHDADADVGAAAAPGAGVLVCALAGGCVQVLDAASLRPLAVLGGAAAGGCGGPAAATMDAVGAMPSLCGKALWVLYADRSLARWQSLEACPDWALPAPVSGVRDARVVLQPSSHSQNPQVVTCTERALQLWTSTAQGMKMISRADPGGLRIGELTALACTQWSIACGHRSGEVHLVWLPDLGCVEALPVRHSGEVLALCFCSSVPGHTGPTLLASASRDRSAMVFRIDGRRRSGTGAQNCCASLLLTLPGHSAAVHSVALLGVSEAPEVQLALCTADKVLVLRDLEIGPSTASVLRSHKQQVRSKSWIGLCAHPSRPILFAATGDRRVLQLDSSGRTQQALRFGGPEVELVPPLRLGSPEGRLLAVGIGGSSSNSADPGGVLLLDASAGLRPLARLIGHAEPMTGISFLGADRVLGCWADGTMLVWDVPEQDVPLEWRREDHRAALSPQRTRLPKPRASTCCDTSVTHRCPEGFLERLLASSPKPPRWAGGKDALGVDELEKSFRTQLGKWARGSKVGAQVRSASDLHALVAPSELQPNCVGVDMVAASSAGGVGRSARIFSAQVRSASEGASPMASKETIEQIIAQQVTTGASGTRTLMRATSPLSRTRSALFPHRSLSPLPPKPVFPPPALENLPSDTEGKPSMLSAALAVPSTPAPATAAASPPSPHALESVSPPAPALAAPTSSPVAGFRADIQRLCADALLVLPPSPEATEVSALLRRVNALLRCKPLVGPGTAASAVHPLPGSGLSGGACGGLGGGGTPCLGGSRGLRTAAALAVRGGG